MIVSILMSVSSSYTTSPQGEERCCRKRGGQQAGTYPRVLLGSVHRGGRTLDGGRVERSRVRPRGLGEKKREREGSSKEGGQRLDVEVMRFELSGYGRQRLSTHSSDGPGGREDRSGEHHNEKRKRRRERKREGRREEGG